MTRESEKIDQQLAGILRGDLESLAKKDSFLDPAAAAERIKFHGVAHQITDRLTDTDCQAACATNQNVRTVALTSRDEATAQCMWEMRHGTVIAGLLAEMGARGLEVLVLKGTALAYSVYPTPSARRRCDSDLLIRSCDLEKSRAILERLGFQLALAQEGLFGSMHLQETWVLSHFDGSNHQIDLHWAIANSQVVSSAFSESEIWECKLPIEIAGQTAQALATAAQFRHCALHAALSLRSPYLYEGTSHSSGERLIWALDLRLLADRMTDQDWLAILDASDRRGGGKALLYALDWAEQRLGPFCPASMRAALKSMPSDDISRYILSASEFEKALAESRTFPTLSAKLRFWLSKLFPSRDVLRVRDSRKRNLVVLYFERAFRALKRYAA